MYDPVFDPKTQAAKSSIDAALGVAQRVQQRMGVQPAPQGVPAAPVPQGMQTPPRPPQTPFQQPQPGMPQPGILQPGMPQQVPPVWPTMPGANPLLQQLMSQYATRPQQPAPGMPVI